MRFAFAAVAVIFAVSPVAAAETAIDIRYGERGGFSLKAASLSFGELWSKSAGSWSMRLHPVIEGGTFRYSGSRASRDDVSYGGVGVGFRMVRELGTIRPYLELGLGGSLFSSTTVATRNLSTRFQFTEWVGVGLEFARHVTVGWRYSHFSNASIKQPNDGIDIHQIVVGARF